MSDTYNSTDGTSFFGSIKNAIVGTVLGLVMVPSAVGLLAWNEYRTIHRTRGLEEGAEVVKTIDPADANPSLAGELVHLSGRADTQERVRDDLFGVEMKAIRLDREVETYQWVETTTTRKEGGRKVTKHQYDQQWEPGQVEHAKFKHSQGHENPQPTFEALSQVAKVVTVGAYQLNDVLKNSIDSRTRVKWSEKITDALPPEIKNSSSVKGPYLYYSEQGSPNPTSPVVGDQRICFHVVRPTDISLVSAVSPKSTNEFTPFVTRHGEELQRLYVGSFSAAEIFQKMRQENQAMAWILRGGGLLASFIGFTLIMSVLSALTDRIPIVRSMAGAVIGFVSFLLAIVVTSLTIAVAWIAVRPLLGSLLIAIAVVVSVIIWRSTRKRDKVVVPVL